MPRMTQDGRGRKARRWKPRIALAAALSLLIPAGHAADDTPNLSLRGFYTLNVSMARGHDVYYPPDANNNPLFTLGEGKANFDFSLVGAQAELALTDRLRFTAQVVSGAQTGHDNRPVVDWAYLTQDLGDDLYLRAGKLKTPFLQGTELRYVGFSRLWVRPLVPNSGAGGMDVYHGVEFIKSTRLEPYNLRLQGGLGVPEHERPEVDGKDIKHLSLHFERNESWIKFAAFQSHTDIHTKTDGRLLNKDTALTMYSVETELWLDKFVVNAGYAKGQGEVAPDETLRYASLAYRHEALTPYFLYQFREMLFPAPSQSPPRRTGAPPGPAPAPSRQGPHQTDTYALGMRYDLGASQALKFQVERQYDKDSSFPTRGTSQTAATIFSVVFEGVF